MNIPSKIRKPAMKMTGAAEHWLTRGCSDLGVEAQNICAKAAQELGNRTGYMPLVAPVSMLVFLAVSPQLFKHWLPILALYLLMVIATTIRIALAKKLIASNNQDPLHLVRHYQTTVDITGLTWGSLVGLLLLIRGIDQITELALVVSLGITAGAFASLTLELSLWRRFIFVLWLPVITLTAATATQGVENGWVLLAIELLFVSFAGIQGQLMVRDYILGLLSRSDLEYAVSKIDDQRGELRAHQKQLGGLLAQTTISPTTTN